MIQAATRFIGRYSHINWALADQTMVSGVNFLTGILLARYLGVEEFGRFTLVWLAVLFVNNIQHTAINSPMMSIGPKQPEAETPAYYGAIIVQQLIFSCVVFFLFYTGVLLSAVVFPEWRVESLALPLAIAATASQLQDFLRRYFFTRGRAAMAFINDTIRYLGQIVLLIWLFTAFEGAMDTAKVIWIIAILAAIATAFGAFFIEPIALNAVVLSNITSRHWHFSKWLTGSALMQWATGNLFIIAAGAILGASAVGALRAAQNLMGLVHILFMGLENIVPSRAARLFHSGGKQALSKYLKKVTLFGGGATAVIAVIAAAVPALWLRLAFGSEFQGYGFILQWWAAIYVLIFLSLPLRAGLRAIEQPRAIFWAYLGMTLFSILAAYPMVENLGLTGAMGGILIANIILISTLLFDLRRRLS